MADIVTDIRARHQQHPDCTRCEECNGKWPCDAVRAADEIEILCDGFGIVANLEDQVARLMASNMGLVYERDALAARLDAARVDVEELEDEKRHLLARVTVQQARLDAARAYVDDPGNWSTLDGRRAHILRLLDGTE